MGTQNVGTCAILILAQVQPRDNPSAHPLALVALVVSLCALVVALMNYRRKAGVLVRGSFTTTSSRASNGKYLSSVVIENLKDRAITVFAIYLKLGSNYYIEIEDFQKKPLVLRAFETYQKEYGPIEFYGVNTSRINLDGVFDDRRAKKRLVLSTSDGKYTVPSQLRTWSPVHQMFRNYLTAVVRPVRSSYKDKDIGGGIKFIIDILHEDGNEEIIPVNPRDWEVRILKHFQLSQEALETRETLETFLRQQVDSGKLACKKCTVFDMQTWRAEAHSGYSRGTMNATYYSALHYYVIGKVSTMYVGWRQRRENTRQAIIRRELESGKERTDQATRDVVVDSEPAEKISDESVEDYVAQRSIAEIVGPGDEVKGQSEIFAALKATGDLPEAPRLCEDSSDLAGDCANESAH